ncbi:CDP-glycerol glycerophosphotransferase family protein [Neobacillus niacini]|uniref:CDP-glycerol glycerophosphotransferase family protein n=1 Tax=Neobacillus niacini TaxID=86668 RepID=UPI002864E854|nr:CDP-glycerol glycerophosphotransferase family protein [Neobacillus niacini]MDR6998826.1 CDP-glycerol glycerophosphotransferase (TagB/SpsB family) [Neobacillus niacini]
MVRELAISLYLFVFKCVFSVFNLIPLKDKTTFVISFGDNSRYVFEEMRRQTIQNEVVFLCKGKSIALFKDYDDFTCVPFETYHLLNWFKSIYHLATSKHIFVDNYFGFLAAVIFKEEVTCVQLWHASGAIKKFGLEDGSVKNRSERAKQRFLQVYQQFDKVVVGSDVMAATFMKSFNLKKETILTTGVPRTDFFFNEKEKQKAIQKLTRTHRVLKDKKVILYAPTYRDHELENFSIQLNVEKMSQELGNEYMLILRLHPAIGNSVDFSKIQSDFVFDFSSSQYEINELLAVADYLITDYSSIPFEFSLLRKPIIFFAYDLEEYKKNRGVLYGFEENLPGPIAKDTDSIIKLIQNNDFDLNVVDRYAEKWNKYSNGRSSQNLVSYLFEEKSPQVEQRRALL